MTEPIISSAIVLIKRDIEIYKYYLKYKVEKTLSQIVSYLNLKLSNEDCIVTFITICKCIHTS